MKEATIGAVVIEAASYVCIVTEVFFIFSFIVFWIIDMIEIVFTQLLSPLFSSLH